MKIPFPVRALPRLAFQAWLTPPPLGRSTLERDRESIADLSPVFFGGVPGYEIGTGPVALVLHGWGGRTAQMAPIARRLANEGRRVLVPQVPGYAGGPATDIKQAASAVRAVVEDVGWPQLVVAHSFASMVLRLAFPDQAPARVALIAPALDVHDALDVFGDKLRLMPWARRGLRKRLEAWDLDLWPTVSQSLPTQLSGAEVLIIHDPDDRETAFGRAAELAAVRPDTSIVAVAGAGHSRILSNPETLDCLTCFALRMSHDQRPARKEPRWIARTWRGWTRRQDVDAYVEYLMETGIKEYLETPGNRAAHILRRDADEHTEFVTLTFWDSLEAVHEFAGLEAERAVFYPEDDRFLVDRETTARNYEIVDMNHAVGVLDPS